MNNTIQKRGGRYIRLCKAAILALSIAAATVGLSAVTQQVARADYVFSITPTQGPVEGGTLVNLTVPSNVKFTQISGYGYHDLGLGTDGVLYAWGMNNAGQLGSWPDSVQLDYEDNPAPTPVVGLPQGQAVDQIATGDSFSMALMGDGTLWVWGSNSNGQLTNVVSVSSSAHVTPLQVQGLPSGLKVTSISAAGNQAFAIMENGSVYGWGDNSQGQLGYPATDGNKANSVPHEVTGLPAGYKATHVYAGGSATFIILDDNSVYSMGGNSYGQTGVAQNSGTTKHNTTALLVTQLPKGVNVVKFGVGGSHTLALMSDGTVYSFGNNVYGQLGIATNSGTPNVSNNIPTLVASLPAGVVSVEGGSRDSFAILSDGSVYGFGYNLYGQLGNTNNVGSTASNWTPSKVLGLPAGSSVTAVESGQFHTVVLLSDGSAYAFGNNQYGQLGELDHMGSALAQPNPTLVGEVSIDYVDFGASRGLNLQATTTPNVMEVTTPQYPRGTVDVKVIYRVSGIVQTPATLSFTYIGPYLIEFDTQSDEVIASQNVDEGDTIAEPSTPTKEGFTFLGWSESPDGLSGLYDFTIPPTDDMTLYAQWSADQYVISFDANTPVGASTTPSGSMSNQQATFNQNVTLTANAFALPGYTFTGWNTAADGSGTAYADAQAFTPWLTAGAVTLYAQWSANVYTVSFDANVPSGASTTLVGSMDDETYTFDQDAILTANDFSLQGYTFTGWNTAADGSGTAYKDASTISPYTTVGDTTLFAQWSANEYELVFDANKPASASTTPSGSMGNQTVVFDQADNLVVNEYTLSGYSFTGWNTQADGSGLALSDEDVLTLDKATFDAWNTSSARTRAVMGTLTLFAQWTKIEDKVLPLFNITFDSQGGSDVPAQAVTEGDVIVEPSSPTKAGYTFAGWSSTADGSSGLYDFATPPTGDMTLYASWVADSVDPVADPPAETEPTLAQTGTSISMVAVWALVLLGAAGFSIAIRKLRLSNN